MGELNPNGSNKTVEAPVSKIGVGGVVQKLEGDLVPEKTKQVELSQEDQLKNLANQSEIMQRDITVLTASIEQTKIKLNEARKKFGLAPTEEDPPSVSSGNDRLEKLQAEQEAFEKQRKEIISKQERTELITKENKKIAQEKSRTEEAEPAKSALEESEHVEAQASNNLSNNFDKTKKVV